VFAGEKSLISTHPLTLIAYDHLVTEWIKEKVMMINDEAVS